jgi:hypothetical protein
MRHSKLSAAQAAAVGFTDLFVVTSTDLAGGTSDNTAYQVALDALNLGDVVDAELIAEIVTPFASAGGSPIVTLTFTVGTAGTPAQLLATSGLIGTSTGVAAKTAYVPPPTVGAYKSSGGENLVAEFTPDNAAKTADATAGEVWIWAKISRSATRGIVNQNP